MNLKNKLSLAFLLVALVPVCLVGFIALYKTENALKESVGIRFKDIAEEKAAAISWVLGERIFDARNLAVLPGIIDALSQANRRYAGMDEAEIRETITRIDAEWIASGGKTPEADKALNNPLTTFFKSYQSLNPDIFGEVFVTDRQGATVAMSRTLTDYYQADEQWWTAALDEGLFIDDRGYDLSVNAFTVGVVVPVKEQGEIIGVLKINYKVGEILNIVARNWDDKTERVILARSQGTILMSSLGLQEVRLSESMTAYLSNKQPHYYTETHNDWVRHSNETIQTIEGHAPVAALISTRVHSPDAVKGIKGERWEPTTWHLFIESNQETAYAGISALRRLFIVVVAMVLIVSGIIWLWISRSISRPILALRKDALIIGSGNLDHEIAIHAKDEIGALSRAFNMMTSRLKETLASRDELNREIDEHKQTEDALRESEERYRVAAKTANDAIVNADDKGVITYWNKAAERIFGYAEGEVVGQPISRLIPVSVRPKHKHAFKRANKEGRLRSEGAPVEAFALTKDGDEVPVELSLSMWEAGSQKFFTAIIRDISERKQSEKILRHAHRMVSIGQMVGGIAHDFNNILAIIMGNLEIIEHMADGRKPLLGRLKVAMKGAQRGTDLTRRLLAFSHQEGTGARPCAINETLLEMRDLLEKLFSDKVGIEFNLSQELWAVEINVSDFEDVVVNLALNARDAMPDGGTLTIETANKYLDEDYAKHNLEVEAGDYVQVSISDTGMGMSPDIIERAFDPFFTTKETGKGTGLGLCMVYGFIKRSRGHVKIYSPAQKGTTLRIYLPRSPDVEETPEETVAEELKRGAETVLVVDDEKSLLEISSHNLKALGYKVITANGGNEALKILKGRRKLDLLFSDVVMPGGVDGFDLARDALKKRPQIKVLLTTGFTVKLEKVAKGDDPWARRLAANILRKPYNKAELANAVRHILDEED